MSIPALDEATLDGLYQWLDRIPFSRRRKNIALDFSDGVLVAELVHNFLPRIVDLHNYTEATASVGKRYNWNALNKRIFSKLGYQMTNNVIQNVIMCKPGAIEFILLNLRPKIEHALTLPQDSIFSRPRTSSTNSRSVYYLQKEIIQFDVGQLASAFSKSSQQQNNSGSLGLDVSIYISHPRSHTKPFFPPLRSPEHHDFYTK